MQMHSGSHLQVREAVEAIETAAGGCMNPSSHAWTRGRVMGGGTGVGEVGDGTGVVGGGTGVVGGGGCRCVG